MDLHSLLEIGPLFHQRGGQPYSWGLSRAVLEFLDANVHPGARTLETGCGISTVVFAFNHANHICVSPDETELLRIKAFCLEHGIPTPTLRFVLDYSQRYLPRLEVTDLDLVLIDGAHGFPMPFVDWYYTADRLKVGGLLILDDTHIWSVHVLKLFLMAEPEWAIERDFAPRSVAFRKVRAGSAAKNESEQPYVAQQTAQLLFRVYPRHVESMRMFLPEHLVRTEERRLRFRAYRLRRALRSMTMRALPGPIKRGLKRVIDLTSR